MTLPSLRLLPVMIMAPLLLFTVPSSAQQTLNVSLSGEVFNCADSGLDKPIDVSFTIASGGGTVMVDLGGEVGSFPISISEADFQSFVDAVDSAGGTYTMNFGPELLSNSDADPEYLCEIQGTLTITLSGDSTQAQLDSQARLEAASAAQVDNFVRNALPAFSKRVQSVFRGEGTGVLALGNGFTVAGTAAGEGNMPSMGVWAGYSYTDSKNDYAPTAYKSDGYTVLLGIDTMPSDNVLLGVGLSLENTDVDTRFNGGQQDITAFGVTPYLGVLLNEWLTLDAAVGLSTVRTDQSRTAGAARVTSDVDSFRLFASANATATWALDRLLVSGRAGMLYATQDADSYVESNGTSVDDNRYTVGRFLLGGELAYGAGAWEPYVAGTFGYDFTRTKVLQEKNDDTDVLFSLGVRYFGGDDISGALEYSTLLDRRNLSEHSVNANLRWSF